MVCLCLLVGEGGEKKKGRRWDGYLCVVRKGRRSKKLFWGELM